MTDKKFKRTKENFVCEKCNFLVEGDGYTNHCPKCLWSKHVDINPGDRKESCQGLMEPISVGSKSEEYVLTHRCTSCNFEKKNKTQKNDDFDIILKLSSKLD